MYTKYYGFIQRPFEITPNPDFLYLSENHKEALAHLIYALKENKGFTVITGEVGTGKTTIINALLRSLDGNTRTAYLFNPNLDVNDFLQYICEDFGLNTDNKSKWQYLSELHKFLLDCYSRNENVVLIIDEAQILAPGLLEEIRLLTNFETSKKKLLQVILVGQPELNTILGKKEFRQLRQRISLRYHIHALDKKEMLEYIKIRLKIAGGQNLNLFSAEGLKKIYKYSKGVPRVINILCDNALLSGYASERKNIDGKIITEIARQLSGKSHPQREKRFKKYLFFSLLISLGILGYLVVHFGHFGNSDFVMRQWYEGMPEAVRTFFYQILTILAGESR